MNKDPEEFSTPPLFPLEKVLGEMAELLQFTTESIESKTISSEKLDFSAKLENLQRQIDAFQQLIPPVEKQPEKNFDGLPQEQQELLQKCESLTAELGKKIETMQQKEKEALLQKVVPSSLELEETVDEAASRRKRGLKRIGRGQRWKQS